VKVIKINNIFDTPFAGADEVTIDVSASEFDELVQALSVVDKFKAEARKALNIEQESDWMMYKFSTRDGIVEVRIDQGMCG
jgi:hypothetical protein